MLERTHKYDLYYKETDWPNRTVIMFDSGSKISLAF